MYEYNKTLSEEALISTKKAESYLKNIQGDMSKASSLASNVKVNGLEFLRNSNYLDTINIVSNYSSIIIGMMYKAERVLIIECLESGNHEKLVGYINDGKVGAQTLIEYAKEFMLDIMNSGRANNYNVGFKVINGSVDSALASEGLSDEFIYNLSNEYCKNLVNNNLMYTKEGATTMAVSFTGLLAMFGMKLGYKHVEFDRSYNSFYFGTGEEGTQAFGAIDCCNITDWFSRCVGIDISAYGPDTKHWYAKDGYTPEDEINVGKDSYYFKKAEGGDYLSNSGHIMMIVANDGNGYFFAEDGQYGEINYMTYDALANKGYKVTNTDALYRNTAKPHEKEGIWYDENGKLSSVYHNSPVPKEQVFANPYWIIEQKNINLTLEEQEKLIQQYNERNKNENFTGIPFVPVTPSEPTTPVTPSEPTTPVTPSEPTTPVTPSEPTTPVTPSEPTTPVTPSKPTTPDTPSNVIKNILPDNKFSDYLPGMSDGRLGYMEISKSSVTYEIHDVNPEIYDNYVNELLEQGYTMSREGVFVKDSYQITTTIGEDGNMTINLISI